MRFLKSFSIILLIIVGINTTAQSQTPDSVTLEVLKIMNEKLSRTDQLAILDYVLKSEFDLQYEVSMVMENMDEKEREDVLLHVMRKANIPIKPKGEHAEIYWKEVEYTFDNVPSGRKYSHVFEFENIGKIPFKIEDISSSCGCTLADMPNNMLMPGETSSLTVTFDATRKSRGEYTEFVTITGNTFPRKAVLIVYANIR